MKNVCSKLVKVVLLTYFGLVAGNSAHHYLNSKDALSKHNELSYGLNLKGNSPSTIPSNALGDAWLEYSKKEDKRMTDFCIFIPASSLFNRNEKPYY